METAPNAQPQPQPPPYHQGAAAAYPPPYPTGQQTKQTVQPNQGQLPQQQTQYPQQQMQYPQQQTQYPQQQTQYLQQAVQLNQPAPTAQSTGAQVNTVSLVVWSRAATMLSAVLLGISFACFWPGIICGAVGMFFAMMASENLARGATDPKSIKTNLVLSFSVTAAGLITMVLSIIILIAVLAA